MAIPSPMPCAWPSKIVFATCLSPSHGCGRMRHFRAMADSSISTTTHIMYHCLKQLRTFSTFGHHTSLFVPVCSMLFVLTERGRRLFLI